MFLIESIGMGSPSADLIQDLLKFPLSFSQFRSLASEFGIIIANFLIKCHHLVDQLEIVLVVEKYLPLSIVGENHSPKLDFFLETLGRKLFRNLIQGKRSRRKKARRQEKEQTERLEHYKSC